MAEKTGRNRLKNEKSPYLKQHAGNPVDWYPWGEEAFLKAKAENKPIFLSIGYSACHWCHVMNDESFEDEGTAEFLNENFVSVKVDREERPDIDSIYMNACQMMTGSGGWPLSAFLTPDKKPFFCGTYFPRESGYGLPAFRDLLRNIVALWEQRQDEVVAEADSAVKELNRKVPKSGVVKEDFPEKTYLSLLQSFDSENGGFMSAPKFPTPHKLLFLIKYGTLKDEPKALWMAEKTLISMYRGGIYDQVGFGFCRYSTDAMFLVPHFEKMLYDNALLAYTYTEAYSATKKPIFKKAAEDTITYLLRDMQNSDGAFYTSEDADSAGGEGRYYLFTKAEVAEVLGENCDAFCKAYGITDKGNFEGANILSLQDSELYHKFESELSELFAYRESRERPFRDEKVLVSNTGLAIAALAYAGRVFDSERYIDNAKKAAAAVLATPDLRFADDYSCFIFGLIELYMATVDEVYLKDAELFMDEFLEFFYAGGAFHISGRDEATEIARPSEIFDSDTPSYNSLSVYSLFRLARLISREDYVTAGGRILENFSSVFSSVPDACAMSALCALLLFEDSSDLTVLSPTKQKAADVFKAADKIYAPFPNYFYKEEIGETRALICRNRSCTTVSESLKELTAPEKENK